SAAFRWRSAPRSWCESFALIIRGRSNASSSPCSATTRGARSRRHWARNAAGTLSSPRHNVMLLAALAADAEGVEDRAVHLRVHVAAHALRSEDAGVRVDVRGLWCRTRHQVVVERTVRVVASRTR